MGALSQRQATYDNNGELGMVIGDEHLSYAPKNVTEIYYNAQLVKHANLTGDLQLDENPTLTRIEGRSVFFGQTARRVLTSD